MIQQGRGGQIEQVVISGDLCSPSSFFFLSVMDQEIPKRIPMVGIHISGKKKKATFVSPEIEREEREVHLLWEKGKRGGNTYIYVILLLKLVWIVSGYHLKRYMTKAQLRLAKTVHALSLIFCRVVGLRRSAMGDGVREEGEEEDGWMESLARDSITRAKT